MGKIRPFTKAEFELRKESRAKGNVRHDATIFADEEDRF
jgi:hypothetical protein